MTTGPTLQSVLRDRLAEAASDPALGWYSGRECRWSSGAELDARSAALAARLAEEGLEPGAVCAVVLSSDPGAALTVLAVLRTGAVPVLVAPPILRGGDRGLARTVVRVAERAGARVAAIAAGLPDLSAALAERGVRVVDEAGIRSALEGPAGTSGWAETRAGDVCFLQLTSGTTNDPKICVWRHGPVLAALESMAAAMEIESGDIVCNWTPLYHDMGLVNNFLLGLATRTPLVMLRPTEFVREPAVWLRALSDTGATVTWSPNFGYALAVARAAEDELEDVRLDGVRAFWNAAERIHPRTAREFAERFAPLGVRWEAMKGNFGCAENVGGATFTAPGEPMTWERVDPAALHEERVARLSDDTGAVEIAGVGRPAPGLEARILDEAGEPLPDGHVGEIALVTPSRMDGYLGDPAATAAAIDGPWLKTGDLGYLRGEEVFWVGRTQERIVVNARKFDPSDFEAVLLEIEGLRPGCFVAFGVDDEAEGTQRLVIASEYRANGGRPRAEIATEVRIRIQQRHGIRPHDVVLVAEGSLPKTSSGKRRHRHFKSEYLAGRLTGGE
ncbi:MAG TPA: AMP-binding protein [Gemmatimonadota bacterium]|nr:AMP-binding protein [Gemmatimonadota bacterium]